MAYGEEEEAYEGVGGVDEQQLEAGLVAGVACEGPLREPRQGRGRQAHDGDEAVAHGAAEREAEDEQAQDGAVGVAGEGVDCADGVLVAHIVEYDDDKTHYRRHAYVHALACARKGVVGLGLVCAEDVDGEARGERGQRRAGSRVGGGDEAEHEEDGYDGGHGRVGRHHAEDVVALLGQRDAVALQEDGEQRAEHQEQRHDEELGYAADYHVFLRLAAVAAREVALHHILIEAVGCHGHEYAGHELLPEVCSGHGVVEEEHLRAGVRTDGLHHVAEAQSEVAGHEIDAQHYARNQAEAFQRVGPDQSLDATVDGVEPNQGDGEGHVDDERNAQRVEHEQLEHRADYEEAHGGAEHLAGEEEPRARTVGAPAEAFLKVAIDADELAAVEERHEHEGYHEVSHDEAQHHLKVGVALGHDHAGNADEGDAGDHGPDHGEGYHGPGSRAAACEECGVVGSARAQTAHEHQQQKIGRDGKDDDYGCAHGRVIVRRTAGRDGAARGSASRRRPMWP